MWKTNRVSGLYVNNYFQFRDLKTWIMLLIWENEMLEVVEKDGFKSLYAKKYYIEGEIISYVEGEEITQPNRYSVQVGENLHVNVKEPVMYINHNCDGNIFLKDRKFISNRVIKIGEEITFDYNRTELNLAEPFECFRCGQIVKGKQLLAQFPCLKK